MNIESQAYLTEDYYPNYSYGAHTYVNVLRHPDVEYFVRLKRAFKQTWNPFPAVQQHHAAGGAQQNSIVVVLAVSVDAGGNMSELFVLKSSGSGYYDEEALRTVRANSPFSAPPSNLLKENLLRMSWTFIVYM
jgi:TonB family protein